MSTLPTITFYVSYELDPASVTVSIAPVPQAPEILADCQSCMTVEAMLPSREPVRHCRSTNEVRCNRLHFACCGMKRVKRGRGSKRVPTRNFKKVK